MPPLVWAIAVICARSSQRFSLWKPTTADDRKARDAGNHLKIGLKVQDFMPQLSNLGCRVVAAFGKLAVPPGADDLVAILQLYLVRGPHKHDAIGRINQPGFFMGSCLSFT